MSTVLRMPVRLEREDAVYPFEMQSFFENWWSILAPKFRPVRREGQMAVVKKPVFKGLPVLRTIRIAGWNNHYYQNLSEERFEEFQALSRKTQWDYFELYWNEAYTNSSVFEIFGSYGYQTYQLPAMACPVIELGRGWEAWVAQKGANFRRDLNRKLDKASHLEPKLVFFNGANAVDEFFDYFIPHHLLYWSGKTGASYLRDAREQEFLRTWAKDLAQSGHLQLTGLVLGGEIANMGMNILLDNTLYCLLTINTGVYADCYPGVLNQYLLIEKACDLGVEKMDLGPGDSVFKSKLATRKEQCHTLLVPNPKSIPGRLYAAWRSQEGALHKSGTWQG